MFANFRRFNFCGCCLPKKICPQWKFLHLRYILIWVLFESQFKSLPSKKTTESRGESFCDTSFQVEMDLRKVKIQDKEESTQEDYPTIPTTKQWRKGRQYDYPTLAVHVYAADVGQSSCLSFPPLFGSRVVFLWASSFPCLYTILTVHLSLKWTCTEIFSPSQNYWDCFRDTCNLTNCLRSACMI